MKRIAGLWIDLLVLLVYVGLSLALSYPLPAQLETHIPGRQVDARVFQWNNWWVKESLFKGQNPFYTDRFYHPSGASLAGHNINWVSSALSVPLDLVFGPTVAYNLTFLLTLFGSAFTTYLLVRYLAGRRDAAFVAGLVFAFYPYHLSGNWDGQMNLANTQWLPLFMLFFLRTVDRKRIGDAVWSGVFLALASLDCWFFALFLAVWGVVFLAYSLLVERARWNARLIWLGLLAAAVCGLLVAPFVWPILAPSEWRFAPSEWRFAPSEWRFAPSEWRSGSERGREGAIGGALDYFAEHKSTDLLAFVVPSSDHPLLSRYVAPAYERFAHWRPATLGYLVLALALYAAVRAWPKSLLWVASGLLCASLALGTVLRIGGIEHPRVPMPLAGLIALWPAFKLIRQASRFNVMVGLSLAVLVGLACADIFQRLERRLSRRPAGGKRSLASPLVAAAIVGVVIFEYLAVPCPLLPARVSPWYTALAQEAEDPAIVELPLGLLTSGRSLHGQTVHGKRMVNGYVARAASDVNPFVLSSPLLKALYVRMEPDPTLHDLPAELGVLAANDIRYLVLHKTPVPPYPAVEADVQASWRKTFERLGLQPHYEDAEILVYGTQPAEGRLAEGQVTEPILYLGDELGLTAVHARRTGFAGKHFLTVDLTWVALQDLSRDAAITLSLEGPGGTLAQAGTWGISPHYPTSAWRQGVVVAERYAIPLDPALPGGEATLTIRVQNESTGQELGAAQVPTRLAGQAGPLAPALEAVPFTADVTFGDQMWLLGYDWQVKDRRLALDLWWQALDVMGTNYKVFVHLIDVEDGEIVAQVDTMPRGWSYPTTLWSRQEIFQDRIELSLRDVEPGQYRVAIGVYRPETGRLPAVDAQGRRIADERVILEKQ